MRLFINPASLHAFIDDRVSGQLRKGYREASEAEPKKEAQTAKSLGVDNKIKRLLSVDLKGKTLALLNKCNTSGHVPWRCPGRECPFRRDAA
jgi:hypothetical protein